jgi:hypothetical protein
VARPLLERTFSWSVSRDRLFRSCPRAYYYKYYGAWGGWEPGAAPDVRELYVLKQLKTRYQWIGDAVHRALRDVLEELRRGRLTPLPEADARLTRVMRFWFKASREGAYWREPKRGGLVEHEYAAPVPVEAWRALHEEARRALSAAYRLPLFERLARLAADDWLAVEAFDSFDLDGVPVHCVPDLSFREGDRVVIVDWKTGPPEPETAAGETAVRFQLACYGLHARARWGARPETLRLGVAFLTLPDYRESGIEATEMATAEAAVQSSVAAMRARLADPVTNRARIEDFPQVDDPARCVYCPFRRPCRGADWAAPPETLAPAPEPAT